MQAIAISIGMWVAKMAVRALLKRVSATFQDALKPVAKELSTAAAATETKLDDKAAKFLVDVVGAE